MLWCLPNWSEGPQIVVDRARHGSLPEQKRTLLQGVNETTFSSFSRSTAKTSVPSSLATVTPSIDEISIRASKMSVTSSNIKWNKVSWNKVTWATFTTNDYFQIIVLMILCFGFGTLSDWPAKVEPTQQYLPCIVWWSKSPFQQRWLMLEECSMDEVNGNTTFRNSG